MRGSPVFQPKRQRLSQDSASGNEVDSGPRTPSIQRLCAVCNESKTAYFCEECSLAQGDILPVCNVDTTKTGSITCLARHIDSITLRNTI